MNVRSLRWRLVIAMAAIIAAVVAAAGAFSSLRVKRRFEQFLVAEKMQADVAAREMANAAGKDLEPVLRRLHAERGTRAIVLNARGEATIVVPDALRQFRITPLGRGSLEVRRQEGEGMEVLRVQRPAVVRPDGARIFLLPPEEGRRIEIRKFRLGRDRWLIAGLVLAALLAVAVMLTIFRRVFRPVEVLTGGARALASGRLETRVPVRGNDEVAELGRAFNSMAEALERNERSRRNMVSDVAHELRTPLTSIRVQIEAAQDGVVDADDKFFASIAEDAATLSRLVDDLQQLSLADAGELRLERAEVSVAELIDRALTGLERKHIDIQRDSEDLTVHVDARRIVQVIRNLLVNALAYARTSITVTARRVGDRVEIRVADDGPGVPDEHAQRIFDRFHRADASRSRSTGGAGLGLAIAKQLVELHGGTIRYDKPAFIVDLDCGDASRRSH
jgi:signal transduction histidine kinase